MTSNRRSSIRRVATNHPDAEGDSMYVVDLYENERLVQSRELPGKNKYYAEDVSENWNSGLIQLLTE